MTENPETVPDEVVCGACGGGGNMHADACVALALGVPVLLQIGDGTLDHIGSLTPDKPTPLGLALASFLRGFADILEERYAEELASGNLDPHPSSLPLVVLRAHPDAPPGWWPAELDGLWLTRDDITLTRLQEFPLLYRAGQPVACRLEETERVESRDGATAQVWEVRPE